MKSSLKNCESKLFSERKHREINNLYPYASSLELCWSNAFFTLFTLMWPTTFQVNQMT